VTDPAALGTLLGEVRARGYSHSIRQLDLSQGAAAATVFDAKGKAMLAVAVLAFSSELDEERVAGVGEIVRATADRITERIGGAPPMSYLPRGRQVAS
jgi:IclR family acetate operon transcriptional repressor